MVRSRSRPAILAGALAALLFTDTLAALPDPGERWIELASEHFRLLSNASERKTAEVARGLQCLRAVLAPWAEALDRAVPAPDRVVVFAGQAHFQPYGPEREDARTAASAFFARDAWGSVVAFNAYPRYQRDRIAPTLYGEYAGFFAHAVHPGLPGWLRSGLADYYSTFGLLAGEALVGEAHPFHAWWLERHSFTSWAEVLTAAAGERVDGDAAAAGSAAWEAAEQLRAQRWLLVHHLLAQEEEAPGRFAELLRRLAAGVPGAEALEGVYGLSPEALASPLRGYVNRRGYAFRSIPVERLFDQSAASAHRVREVPRAEVLVRLGEVLLLRDRPAAAEEHFRAALEADPGYAEARTGLARAALARGDREAAETLLAEAEALGSESAVPYVLHAELLLHGLLEAEARGGAGEALPVARRARELLEKAADLPPALPQREALLGVTYFYEEEEADAGVEHLRRALAGTADAERAAALEERLQAIEGEADARRGHARYDRALELFDRGRLAEALAELEALEDETRDPELRRAASELAREIEAVLPPRP